MQPKKRNHIYQELKSEILKNKLRWLPGEYPLSQQYHVCRETIREALKCLVEDRLVRRSQGRRTMANYVPDKKADTILVVTSRFQNPVEIIQPLATKHNLKVLQIPQEDFNLGDLDAVDTYTREKHIIGIVLCFSWFYGSEDFCELFSKLYIPVYLPYISQDFLLKSHCSGGVQETQNGWAMALRYLASQGHICIATFAPTAKKQFHGIPMEKYGDFLTKSNVDPSPDFWCRKPSFFENDIDEHEPQNHYAEIRAELKRMFSLPNPPTAALCYSNQWAAVLFQVCNDLKIRIPQDLSVMGFLSNREQQTPTLATMTLDSLQSFQKMIAMFLHSRRTKKRRQLITKNEFVVIPGGSVIRRPQEQGTSK